jgi:hypothetical protein
MGIDRQPPALTEVEDILVVQVAVEWANLVWSGQELVRNVGRWDKCCMFWRELKERLEPGLKWVQYRRRAASRSV